MLPKRILATVSALWLGAVGCATNPATGDRQLALVSEEQAAELGRQSAEEIVASVGLVEDAALRGYVERVGQRVARASELPAGPWTFQVLDDPAVNAFALPGGYIFVTRGILARMGSEAELASVLGHEIGHVTARHSISQLSRAQLAQLGLGLGSVLIPGAGKFAGVAQAGLGLLLLKYGRDAERQADELGFRYSAESGYDPRAAADLFEMLSRVGEGGPGRLPGWLATHPDPQSRLEATRERIAGSPRDFSGLAVDRADYLQRLNGLPYGDDPREGYFQGTRFVHPKLGFTLAFPAGWKTANEARFAGAASPDGDAAAVISLAGEGDPLTLARQFLAQEGVQGTAPVAGTTGGLPASATQFVAVTEQGKIEGFASFVASGGKTYRLLGYAPAGRLARNEQALRAALGSFRALDDAALRDVSPPRLEVRTVPEPMTLAEFDRRFPSTVPLEELAALNGVRPDATLEAGRPVKRVVGGRSPAPATSRAG